MQKKFILFICTGNIYRSRFAQAIFNFHAFQHSLCWEAFSRGIAASKTPGLLSPFVKETLIQKNIPLSFAGTDPVQLHIRDLQNATLRIALREEEHKEPLKNLFPGWEKNCLFWHVGDINLIPPERALKMIESATLEIIDTLLQIEKEKNKSPLVYGLENLIHKC
ncbi:protein-tyrosine-phosphatase [Candidatus Methylacidiphilum fumarolicum]|uniref:Protein-tyrosine-phosphatase n=2 Tax=Candidatus Methylacidiphilum fumarolicum TaxID=591154 RepID=I0JVQ7_METFB|nr:protein-tyrosine-phosphatase [Candidatus Methylacidiphilum fumarolicum]MBW6414075.1 protein-tyrosine-phosphatase [Candidatus Methylacidiphilum fumarolicum]TFE66424.1 protein-tyrosine-phosphatase [Candidatus Methylacidiphilum fumarolicum]TFE75239.1 protein-tyrosine-phosphatase [Candidatus Methylacidiphilum fumarolicum]TFE76149.1 protein-tyrosine-phosphatase [Candidatus Methylacidiphilum fumarolicum]TFE77297.1 protein-tyrosine-phosphatase [Candidatus Methylacidiphilum fumarolicum]